MRQSYDIMVKDVRDYNQFVGVETLHPFVSVVHYDELQPIRHSRVLWSIYGLFLLNDDLEMLSYGLGTYDYSIGSIVCVSPSQIGGASDDGTTFCRKGWALLFSPELFHGTGYEKQLHHMEFFHYHVNKALTITSSEQKDCEMLFKMLRRELAENKREEVMVKLIELILAYCSSFFRKQYSIDDKRKYIHMVSRLEKFLDDYYASGEQVVRGLPTVRFCAECLCVSPNYLGDLIRQETGDSAKHYIGRNVIRRAKGMLMSGKTIMETAYTLGFDFQSHLSRLFKRLEGVTPSEYVKKQRE